MFLSCKNERTCYAEMKLAIVFAVLCVLIAAMAEPIGHGLRRGHGLHRGHGIRPRHRFAVHHGSSSSSSSESGSRSSNSDSRSDESGSASGSDERKKRSVGYGMPYAAPSYAAPLYY